MGRRGAVSDSWARPHCNGYLVNAFRDRVRHIPPHHPQSNGKAERYRTLKQEVIRGRTFSDLDHCQRVLIIGGVIIIYAGTSFRRRGTGIALSAESAMLSHTVACGTIRVQCRGTQSKSSRQASI